MCVCFFVCVFARALTFARVFMSSRAPTVALPSFLYTPLPLCRSYEGEEGIDAGGVFKDWLGNISRWPRNEQRLNTNL